MLQPFGVRPRGHHRELKTDKGGPRPIAPERAESDVMVTPLARGLAILSAFDDEKTWLGNKDIALKTGLPMATVSRLLQSLVVLGYLRHDEQHRKYRLASAALSLGYAAIAESEMLQVAGSEMEKLAEASDTHVMLGTRDRLDVIVLGSRAGSRTLLALDLRPGTRLSMAQSIAGAALMAALPEGERGYLQNVFERKAGREWPSQRRRIAEKIAQVSELGFCMSLGEWVPEITSVAVPVCIPEHPPWVLACIGRTSRMTPLRIESELGPRLVAAAETLQQRLTAQERV